jgi:arginase
MKEKIQLIGYASSAGSRNPDCALGPEALKTHPEWFDGVSVPVDWYHTLYNPYPQYTKLAAAPIIHSLNAQLAVHVAELSKNQQRFCVLGGDHSCAIGTWSGVASAYRNQGDLGLIWIDAHLDSHTPETSSTKNLHGMPAAHLLGQGLPALAHLMDEFPKLKPTNLCFIGARSYEEGELSLLHKLGVKIYFMADVKKQGIDKILSDALSHLRKQTYGIGISLDLDAIDPHDAPGVDYREPDGIAAKDLIQALHCMQKEKVLGLEIVEYNPVKDEDYKTARLIPKIINAIYAQEAK